MTEPRNIPLVNIKLPEKQDSLTLFSPQDHWALRLAVHAFRTVENIVNRFGVYLVLGALAVWKYGPW